MRRCLNIANRGPVNRVPAPRGNLINEDITAPELRVIDSDGEQAGIMLLETAQQLADNKKLDLVLISPNAAPPVARIMDYGKFRYEQQKREKEAKKKQKIIEVKEIRLGTFIEDHDLEVKARNAIKFLKDGDKVKVSLRFKGRERGRTDKGFEVMEKFSVLIQDAGAPEKKPVFEGRSLIMILAPAADKEKQQAKPKSTAAPKPESDTAAESETAQTASAAESAEPAKAAASAAETKKSAVPAKETEIKEE